MKRELPPGYREQLELGYVFGSTLTFAQRPLVPDPGMLAEWAPDAAIIGAPFDLGTTNRPGARFGPRGVRVNAYESGTYHLDLRIEIFDHLEVVDAGDAHCPHGMVEASLDNVKKKIAEVVNLGITPIVIGGDHTITWPSATAVAEKYGFGRVGMVHFDAHADTADTIDGNLASHGTPMRRLIESGAIPAKNFVQIGLRGYWPGPDVWKWMGDQGMKWHMMDEVHRRGLDAVITDAIAEAMDGVDHLYVSVDIDSLDPVHAPGTGTPEPGGITSVEMLRAMRRLALETPVVAFDVMEVAPAYDHADCTVNIAHRLIMEVLAGLAAKKRG
ncbi:MAG: agmatinase [Actinobacteria bacterium]|nr:agmatinase [Actinomycetota bacterium]